MELEVYPTKRFVFDSVFHVSSKFKPVGFRPKKGQWLAEPRSIGVAKGNYTTIHESNDFLPEHRDVLDAITDRITTLANFTERVPASYEEAKRSYKWHLWRDACNRELAALSETGAYLIVPRPLAKEIMPSEWLFSIEDDGTCRAKVVTKAVREIDGITYEISNRPLPKHNLFRLTMATAAQHDLNVSHLKFNSAYFNMDTAAEMYVETPPGFSLPGTTTEDRVLKLHKLIEGPAQTPYGRAQAIAKVFRLHGFLATAGGASLFHRGANLNMVLIAVFDEDLLIATNNQAKLDSVKEKLMTQFRMRDLQKVKKISGINIEYLPSCVKLHLGDYIDSLLRDYRMEDCMMQKIPVGNVDLNPGDEYGEKNCSPEAYRTLVGKLAYASITVRFDIDYIVRELLRHLVDPKQKHMVAAKNVLRYLKGTRDYGLKYKSQQSNSELVCHTASSFGKRAGDVYLGYIMTYSGAPIFWRCRFGEGLTEMKHVEALRYVIVQASWTLAILHDLGLMVDCVAYSDNEHAISEERQTLPQFQPKAFTKPRKRAWGRENPSGSSQNPVISLHRTGFPNRAAILSLPQQYNALRLLCSKLNLGV